MQNLERPMLELSEKVPPEEAKPWLDLEAHVRVWQFSKGVVEGVYEGKIANEQSLEPKYPWGMA